MKTALTDPPARILGISLGMLFLGMSDLIVKPTLEKCFWLLLRNSEMLTCIYISDPTTMFFGGLLIFVLDII